MNSIAYNFATSLRWYPNKIKLNSLYILYKIIFVVRHSLENILCNFITIKVREKTNLTCQRSLQSNLYAANDEELNYQGLYGIELLNVSISLQYLLKNKCYHCCVNTQQEHYLIDFFFTISTLLIYIFFGCHRWNYK